MDVAPVQTESFKDVVLVVEEADKEACGFGFRVAQLTYQKATRDIGISKS